jgi:hypothetical protein
MKYPDVTSLALQEQSGNMSRELSRRASCVVEDTTVDDDEPRQEARRPAPTLKPAEKRLVALALLAASVWVGVKPE